MTQSLSIGKIFIAFNLDDMWRYKYKSKEDILQIFFVLFLVVLFIHIGACIFIAIGGIDSQFPNTWINRCFSNSLTSIELYQVAFYYCIVVFTTVGFGDIRSYNTYERIFTIFWMMFGIAFYSYTISFITTHFTNIETPRTLLGKKLKQLNAFALNKNIPKYLIKLVIKNLEYAATIVPYRWLEVQRNILTDLPLELKYAFYKELHREVINCPFFDSNNDAFALRIIEKLKPVRLTTNQFSWGKDDLASCIIFIVKGTMFYMMDNIYYNPNTQSKKINKKDDERDNNDETNFINQSSVIGRIKRYFTNININKTPIENSGKDANSDFKRCITIRKHLAVDMDKVNDINELPLISFRSFGPGSYLGEDEIFYPSPRKYYLKTATNVELMILSRTDFDQIVKEEFPEIYKKLKDYCELRNGFLFEIQKKLLRYLATFNKKDDMNYEEEFRRKKEMSFKHIDKAKEIKKIMELDQIIDETNDFNTMKNFIDSFPKKPEDMEYLKKSQVKVRERVKSPGLVKLYSSWKS